MIDFIKSTWENIPQADRQKILFAAIISFIVSGILGAALKQILAKMLRRIFKLLTRLFFSFFGRLPVFYWFSIKKYFQNLNQVYGKLKVPFINRDLDLSQIFVPIKILFSQKFLRDVEKSLLTPEEVLATHNRILVLGQPGAGKSTMMKSLLNSIIQKSNFSPNSNFPIFVELHSFTFPFKQFLISEVKRHGFKGCDRFLENKLKTESLIILLDGFDEMSEEKKQLFINELTSFVELYKKIKIVLTCRTAVYNNELDAILKDQFLVTEFEDSQIQLFLHSWDFPEDKSIEKFLQALQDRPRIKELARNPLLLTMIAYYYSNSTLDLPRSRAQFYTESTDLLLRQWKSELHLNRFNPQEKSIILQGIANFLHKRMSGKDSTKEISYQEIVQLTTDLFSKMGISYELIKEILDEIVERSGLLLKVDYDEKYKFAHLTLQEYFTARYLKNNPDILLKNFEEDPLRWREVILLTCGLIDDSSEIIRKIIKTDFILALECFVDSIMTDESIRNELFAQAKQLFLVERNSALNRVIGILASDSRPIFNDLLNFLIEKLNSNEKIERMNAIEAFSYSNSQQAALNLLAFITRSEMEEDIQNALIRLGDLSVAPVYKKLSVNNNGSELIKLVSILKQIKTPKSVTYLFTLLWTPLQEIQSLVALVAAHLIKSDTTIRCLEKNSYGIDFNQYRNDVWQWVWAPFNFNRNSILSIVAGRILEILITSQEQIENFEIPNEKISNRISIPYIIVAYLEKKMYIKMSNKLTKQIQEFEIHKNDINELNYSKIQIDSKTDDTIFVKSLPFKFFANSILLRFFTENCPKNLTRNNWIKTYKPKYDFINSWFYLVSSFFSSVFYLMILFLSIYLLLQWNENPAYILTGCIFSIILDIIAFAENIKTSKFDYWAYSSSFSNVEYGYFNKDVNKHSNYSHLYDLIHEGDADSLKNFAAVQIFLSGLTILLTLWISWQLLIGVIIVYLLGFTFYLIGKKREERINPMHSLIELLDFGK